MAYDYAGAAWQTFTRHHAPLFGYAGPSGDPGPASLTRFNAHYAMQAYRYVHDDYVGNGFDPDDPLASSPLAEIPAAKLTLGIPTYGRAFDSVDAGSYDGYPGLFQFTDDSTRRRVPKGTYDGGKWGNTGVFAYWDILLNHGGDAEAPAGNLQVVEPDGVPYGPYVLEGDLFIGFDDAVQVAIKVDYVVDSGFGGVMFWDLPSDLSAVQVDQGLPGAAAAYPDASLVERIAAEFEARSPRAP